jgi:S-adenosylmethionine hydrolase
MILLFTDYGHEGPYLGQVEIAIARLAPAERVIRLVSDAPRNDPLRSAYLLAALGAGFPPGAIVFCVVDPGVGTDADPPVVLELDGRRFVGPDNGLFDIVARRAGVRSALRIDWRPPGLSASFHGRDLYAPVCAMLALGQPFASTPFTWSDRHGWPDDLWEVIYVDGFGNAVTGVRAPEVPPGSRLSAAGRLLLQARTFGDVPPGQPFWYRNSCDLVEIAVNGGSAAAALGLSVGDPVQRVA